MNWQDWYDDGEAPFYTEYLYRLQKDVPKLGLAQAFEDVGVYGALAEIKDDAISVYNRYWGHREVGGETEEYFQHITNRRLLEIQERYSYLITLYKENEEKLYATTVVTETTRRRGYSEDTDVNADEQNTVNHNSTINHSTTSEESSTDESKSRSTQNDTPVTALMDSANYASAIIDGENTDSGTRNGTTSGNNVQKDDGTESRTRQEGRNVSGTESEDIVGGNGKDMPLVEMVRLGDAYMSLVFRFVDEFKTTFINEVCRI